MASTSNAVRQLSDGNSIGTILGQSSSDVIGFYGRFSNTSGISQLVVVGSSIGAVSTAVQSTGGTVTTWQFTTSTQAQAIVSTVVALWNLGLIG